MINPASRTKPIELSQIRKMFEITNPNAINLGIGEPDFNVPTNAISYGINSLQNNITKYDLVPGLKILREEISKKLLIENNCSYSVDEIVVSSGASNPEVKQKLYNAVQTALQVSGHQVLIESK